MCGPTWVCSKCNPPKKKEKAAPEYRRMYHNVYHKRRSLPTYVGSGGVPVTGPFSGTGSISRTGPISGTGGYPAT